MGAGKQEMGMNTATAYSDDPRVRRVSDDRYDIVDSPEGWKVERDGSGWRAWADEYGRAEGWWRGDIDDAFAVVLGSPQ